MIIKEKKEIEEVTNLLCYFLNYLLPLAIFLNGTEIRLTCVDKGRSLSTMWYRYKDVKHCYLRN